MGAALQPLLFPHPPRTYSAAQLRAHPGFIWLDTKTLGKTPAIFVDRSTPQVLLYTHGNAEDLGEIACYVNHMADAVGVSVFAVEYPGYSISEATAPSEAGCYEAVDAAFKHLTEDRKMPVSSIVPFGRSLGSGPAVYIAAHQPGIQGMILQSPLESGARAVLNKVVGYMGYLVDPFKNYVRIERVEAVTCIMHGTHDNVVPCRNGRALYASLEVRGKAAIPLWVEGRGHNDMPESQVFSHMRNFIQSGMRATPPGSGFG